MHDLIIGCGGVGQRVAARAVAAGHRVTGVVRGEASAARVRRMGAASLQCDLDADPVSLPPCDRLFYCAPPARQSLVDERMLRVLNALGASPPQHVVYVSTSGVYGDCGGDWVNEDRPVAPATERARRRVDAEQRVLAWCAHAVILRAPGIYGPGRIPVARIRQGTPILADTDGGWTNRVHVDDLAAIAWRAVQQYWPHRVYNVSDGTPTTMGAYYDALAELLALPAPPRLDWAEAQRQFSAMRLSFLRESRRLSNARLRADFGYRFAFSDFRDGLAASLAAESE